MSTFCKPYQSIEFFYTYRKNLTTTFSYVPRFFNDSLMIPATFSKRLLFLANRTTDQNKILILDYMHSMYIGFILIVASISPLIISVYFCVHLFSFFLKLVVLRLVFHVSWHALLLCVIGRGSCKSAKRTDRQRSSWYRSTAQTEINRNAFLSYQPIQKPTIRCSDEVRIKDCWWHWSCFG